MKKIKILIPSLLAIMACTSIVAGSTYALFTTSDETNIAVTSGKVDLTASLKDLSLYSPKSIKISDGSIIDDTNIATSSAFANGGTANISEGDLTLTNVTPGDKATFKINFVNESNVNIKYRVTYTDVTSYTGTETYKLIDELVVKANDNEVTSNDVVVDWTNVTAEASINDVTISIELPTTTDNNYQDLSSSLRFSVEAVQANAYTGSAKKNASVTAPTAKTGLGYNKNPQALVNAGETDGGTWQYKLNDGEYSTTIPTATNAGTYTVYYKLVGDEEYNDIDEASVNVTIAKADATIDTSNVTKSYTYNGSEQTVNSGATVDSGAVLTYTDNKFTDRPTNGKQTVTINAAETDNYNAASTTVEITINKADQTAPSAPELDSKTSSSVTLKAVSAGQGDTYYGYSTENDASKVDNWKTELTFEGLTPNTTYYFFAKYAGNDNYNEAVSTGTGIKAIDSFAITNKLYLSTTADTANATTIDENGTVTLKYITDSGYPDCLGVKNATLKSYNKATGTLVISNPTDDVVIMDANYLSFTANQDNSSVTIRFEQGSYEYSTNNGATWTSGENSFLGDGGTTIELKKAGDTVLVKGTNCSCYNDEVGEVFWSFAMTGSISAGGSLTSVTDGLGIDKEVTLSISCYEKIFEGCTSLTTAPELPAATLAESCYEEMFYGCTSLTTAPELPAATLAAYCYREMFAGCTSLTSGPEELPAKILSDYCYSGMFYDCIKLTTAPKLSATTLADSCCQAMFSGCTALTNVPEELSVTDLCEDCYFKMFKNCTSLTTAPKLPAVNLEDGCYSNMFVGCTSLTTAPELSATNIPSFGYWSMFDGCTALTITTVKPTIGTEGTDWGVIISGAKTVEGTKPTTDMFNGCACASGVNATPTFAEGTTYYWHK